MHDTPNFPQHRKLPISIVLLASWLAVASPTFGGGGPENLLLVVNPDSQASLTIANHYAALRQVPAANIIYVPWDPKVQTTDIDTFRKQILTPVLSAVSRGQKRGRIDYVAYSSDFPWAVQLDSDVKRLEAVFEKQMQAEAEKEAKPDLAADGEKPKPKRRFARPQHLTPVGSITGLTYLAEGVMLGHPEAYMELRSNGYCRRPIAEQKGSATLGFSSTEGFGPAGEMLGEKGRHFLLSTMLGVTAGRGNSVDEVVAYLRRSADADGTHPAGTIYYVQNGDIRSRVRQGEFPQAVRELKTLGVTAEIVEGVMPMGKKDVQGAMLGTAAFDWKSSGSTILPGAICEHFTSFGGVMSEGAGQTPLSEFLRYGAAGASGTVTEPYAIPDKLPAASIQVHYARGCTLAEAFYQSVFGPYQLLIVGDPLCRPWANIPQVSVAGVQPGANVRGVLPLEPAAKMPGTSTLDHFELFIDGLRLGECGPGKRFEVNTALLADGYHEVRIVAVEAGPIRSQGRLIFPVITENRGHGITTSIPRTTLHAHESMTISVEARGCAGIGLAQGTRWVGKVSGEQGSIEIKASQLGAGPVRLQAVGAGGEKSPGTVLAKPIEITVEGEKVEIKKSEKRKVKSEG